MIGWVAQTGQTLLANDVSQEPRYIAPYLAETRAELDVPLKYHGHLIGVLTLQSGQRDAFTPLDVATLEALAGHIAAAIRNARLYQQERTPRHRPAALHPPRPARPRPPAPARTGPPASAWRPSTASARPSIPSWTPR